MYRLVIEVEYENEATASSDPRKVLEAAANLIASDGMLTMETDLEVASWMSTVEKVEG